MPNTIANLKVKGDRGTFKLRNVITDVGDSHFNISADVGWGSIHGVAALVMGHLAPLFGITQTGTEEAGGHSDAVLAVYFDPPIPDDRWAEFCGFLGQDPR